MSAVRPLVSSPKPSILLSVGIFVVAVALMAFLRLYIFHDRVIALTYGLPLLLCLWHRDRKLLWAMAGAFFAMSAYKAFVLLPPDTLGEFRREMQWLMQVCNVVVIAGTIHLVLNLMDNLRAKNHALEEANDELAARAEEISRQNEELNAQSEELAQQNEEIQAQSEELNQQNEELQHQFEELQAQSEELQTLNSELNQRESMLQTMLESIRGTGDEGALLEQICGSLVDLFRGAAVAATIVEKSGDRMIVLAGDEKSGLAGDVQGWLYKDSFASVVMEHNKTAYVEDLRTRPDLIGPPSNRQFRSVLGTPLRLDGRPAGAVKVFSVEPRHWTTKDFAIIEWVAAQCSLILEARRLREKMACTNENLENTVQDRTAKLHELVGELEHFSYSITHDMRAPLRAMRGFAHLLEEECADLPHEAIREYLRKISTAAARMDRLITDALSYSRAVQEEIPLSPVDATTLLRGMIDSYPIFQAPKAQIEIEENIPTVLANEAGLIQCFSNLLDNAVKFVAPGQQPHVKIRAERTNGIVRLWIEDDGIGISPTMMPRLFGMFQRGSKDYDGTGIGLALVRKVIERMNGIIGVESEPGKGSRFWIELKACK